MSFSFSFAFPAYELNLDESTRRPTTNDVRSSTLTFQPSFSTVASLDIEDLHKELQKVLAETPMSPIIEDVTEEAEDPFDNPFVPYTPIPFIDGDFDLKGDSDPLQKPDPFRLAWNITKWQDACKLESKGVRPPEAEGHEEPVRGWNYPTMDEFLDDLDSQSDCGSCDSYDTSGSTSTPATTPSPRMIARLPKHSPSSLCSSRSTPSPITPAIRTRPADDSDYMPASAPKKRKAKRPMQKPASKKVVFETQAYLKAPNLDDCSRTVVTRMISRTAGGLLTASKDAICKGSQASANEWVHCPFGDCSHKCRAPGDMQRHLLSSKHQTPSIPCPRGCGNMFTRTDAAKRHANSKRCKGRR